MVETEEGNETVKLSTLDVVTGKLINQSQFPMSAKILTSNIRKIHNMQIVCYFTKHLILEKPENGDGQSCSISYFGLVCVKNQIICYIYTRSF